MQRAIPSRTALAALLATLACGPTTDEEAIAWCRAHDYPDDFTALVEFGVCLDPECTSVSDEALIAELDPLMTIPVEREFELACSLVELRSAELAEGAELVLACTSEPALAGSERMHMRVIGRPLAAATRLDVDAGESLVIRTYSYVDAYSPNASLAFAMLRSNDEVVLKKDGMINSPLQSDSRVFCESEGACQAIHYELELAFAESDVEPGPPWLASGEVGELGDGLRAWVTAASGFRNQQCGITDSGASIHYLIARLR